VVSLFDSEHLLPSRQEGGECLAATVFRSHYGSRIRPGANLDECHLNALFNYARIMFVDTGTSL
jgi:hypothetical protein